MPPIIRALIAGNWKMNGDKATAETFVATLRAALGSDERGRCDVAICPPAHLIALMAPLAEGSRLMIGAQDCHVEKSGAHTGDISAEMIADAGGRLIIVGHSERRIDHGEESTLVSHKAAAAHRAGVTAIVCVGETQAERESGRALVVVDDQLARSLPESCCAVNTVVAYEPVWAIGTGHTPTLEEVAEVHTHLRQRLIERFSDGDRIRLLYGGSVKPSNAAALLGVGDVNGALVGGASLDVDDFLAIVDSCP